MTPIRYNGYSSWSTETVATLNPGTTWVSLGDFPCDEVVIYNPATGVSLDVKASCQPDATKYVTVEAPSGATIPVGGNAQEIQVRRTDLSNTPITVRYIWRKFRR